MVGLVHTAIKASPFVVYFGFTYLHANHELHQFNHRHRLKSDSNIDVIGAQTGIAWPRYYGDCQTPLSVSIQGPDLISGSREQIHLIPQLTIRFTPMRGDRQLNTEASIKNNPTPSVLLSSPKMDRNSAELSLGFQIAGGQIDNRLLYGARHSSHTLSQQVSADIVWRL